MLLQLASLLSPRVVDHQQKEKDNVVISIYIFAHYNLDIFAIFSDTSSASTSRPGYRTRTALCFYTAAAAAAAVMLSSLRSFPHRGKCLPPLLLLLLALLLFPRVVDLQRPRQTERTNFRIFFAHYNQNMFTFFSDTSSASTLRQGYRTRTAIFLCAAAAVVVFCTL